LLATRAYAEAVIDERLRVQMANESFCKGFKISLGQTVRRTLWPVTSGEAGP
jgi:hypothetical protein